MREGGEWKESHTLKPRTQRKLTSADVREEECEDADEWEGVETIRNEKIRLLEKKQHEICLREERRNVKTEKAGEVWICEKIIH